MGRVTFQENGFARSARLGRKALCATLSFAVLNASLAPVYGMSGSDQGYKTLISGDGPESKMRPQAPKAPDRMRIQGVFEENDQKAAPIPSSPAIKVAPAPVGYGAWMLKGLESIADIAFAGSKGLVSLFSRGVSYALKNPGEALVAGLATQIATIQAIRPVTDDFLINQNTTGEQNEPAVVPLSNGNAFVAWTGIQAGAYDIYGRVLASNGTAIANEFRINQVITGDQLGCSLGTLSNGNVFVVWFSGSTNIYGRVLGPAGGAITNDLLLSQNAASASYPSLSVSALSNGNTFVVWTGTQIGTADIYGRIFAPNGTALTNDFLINQNTTGIQYASRVAALSNGNAFVTWHGNQAGNADIYGRVLAPNGTALTNEFTVSQVTTGNQYYPSIAALSNDNVFLVWYGDQTGIADAYGRVLSPDGIALTNDSLINQNTTGNQVPFSVAILSNGNAFVTWYGDQTGDRDIYGRVFDLTTTTTGLQTTASQTTEALQTTGIQLSTTGLQTTSVTTELQTAGLQTTARLQTTSQPTSSVPVLVPTLLGVGGAVLGVSLGGAVLTACVVGGICVIKHHKKKQPQKHPEPENLYGSTNDPYIREIVLKNTNTYGTPPEFLPGSKDFQGNPSSLSQSKGSKKDDPYGIPIQL
ncbi:MAG: hypothetical protein ACRCUQ_03025 [Alphaproteobacteria bacterium]